MSCLTTAVRFGRQNFDAHIQLGITSSKAQVWRRALLMFEIAMQLASNNHQKCQTSCLLS